jgi:hypothetical protein
MIDQLSHVAQMGEVVARQPAFRNGAGPVATRAIFA